LDFWNGGIAQAEGFRSNAGITYPILMLAGAAGVGTAYATSYDAVFLVDGAGIIRYRQTVGPVCRPDDLKPVVDQALADLLVPVGDLPARDAFELGAAYPNPFNPATTIPYRLAGISGAVPVDLRILDLQGRTVKVLVAHVQERGRHYEAIWDGRDARGRAAPSGVYLVLLTVASLDQSRFLTLVK
jgi:hypothetical protein